MGGRVSQRVSRAYSKSQLTFCHLLPILCVCGGEVCVCGEWLGGLVSNIEYDNSQNGGLEDYNYISGGIFQHFTTPSIKNKLRVEQICRFFQIIQIIMFF